MMYGLVNQGIEDLVIGTAGVAAWEAVCRRAGVDEEVFISDQSYPDDVSYRLVAATAEVLGTETHEVWRRFGRHWVLETARRAYGELLTAAGRDLPEFLSNLPRIHTRVALIFPELVPPSVECSDHTPNSIRISYRTHRTVDLAPMFEGILEGIAERFQTSITIEHVAAKASGASCDEYLVRWSLAA